MSYDLEPVRAPKLRGLTLRMFTALLESPLVHPFLFPALLRSLGVKAFRKRTTKAAPTNYPLATPPASLSAAIRKRGGIDVAEEVALGGVEPASSEFRFSSITDYARAHRRGFAHATRLNLALGRQFTSLDYVRARRFRTESLREWERVFSGVDVVVTPTTACPPPYLDPRTVDYGESDLGTLTDVMRFVVCGNFCGPPAISIPSGYTGAGLPVGMQAIGRHWEEPLLLRSANVVDQEREVREPAAFYGIL